MIERIIAVYLIHSEVSGWAFSETQAENLEKLMPGYRVVRCLNSRQLERILPEAEIVITWFFRQEWVQTAKNMKVLATPAAGKDYFSVDLPEQVIRINGTFHGKFMAETLLGMLLGMRRGLLQMASELRSENWPRKQLSAVMRPLTHSTTMLLGTGNIGSCFARLLKVFDNRIIGVRRHLQTPLPDWFEPERDCMISSDDLNSYLPQADQVVLILPRSEDTDRILTAERISLLPPHAVICNLGRGNAIDEQALCRALREKRIAGACLDVFQTEPLPEDSTLRSCPNLWWQPHSSAIAPEYLDAFAEDFVRQLRQLNYFSGQ